MNSGNLARGILLCAVAGVLFAMMDATGKHLVAVIPVIQVMWGRYLFQTVVMSVYLPLTTGTRFLRPQRPVLQLIRALLVLSAGMLMYNALRSVPLADATAVLFLSPIVVLILSVAFLKERVGVHRIAAILVGFVGFLLILNPTFSNFDTALLLAVAACLANSVFLLLTRRLSVGDEQPATQFNTTALGSLLLSILVVPVWQTPDLETWLLIGLAGMLGTAGQFLLIKAFSYAPASLLSPFLYSQVLAAGVISVLFFGDALRTEMIAGTVILVGSGIYIWHREHRLARARDVAHS